MSDSEIGEMILKRAHAVRLDPANGMPLVCEVGTDIINLIGVDESQETYTIDFYAWIAWYDSRLKFDPAEFDVSEIIISPNQAWGNKEDSGSVDAGAEKLWNPHLEFMNLVDTKIAEQELRMESTGKCRLTVRQTGTFKFESNEATFREFPFDRQDLTISIESFRWNRDQVRLAIDGGDRQLSKSDLQRITLAEWKVKGGNTQTREVQYSGDPAPFSRASMTITLQRHPEFYMWKVCFPLFILVVIALSAPWISHTKLESRLVLSITTLVAITTYSIVVNSELPKMPYLTVMDIWMLNCFLISAVGALQNIFVSNLANVGKDGLASTIDYHTRWILPSIFAIVTVVAAFLMT